VNSRVRESDPCGMKGHRSHANSGLPAHPDLEVVSALAPPRWSQHANERRGNRVPAQGGQRRCVRRSRTVMTSRNADAKLLPSGPHPRMCAVHVPALDGPYMGVPVPQLPTSNMPANRRALLASLEHRRDLIDRPILGFLHYVTGCGPASMSSQPSAWNE